MATKTVVVAGKPYNDGDWHAVDNPYGLGQGGHRQNNNFINLLLDLLSEASPALQDASTTSLTVGTGSKTLTLTNNRPIPEGVDVYIIDSVTPANRMIGTVTDHTGSQLTVNVTLTAGSGTHASWIVQPTGPVGQTGADGADGADGVDGADYWNTPRVVANTDSPVAALDRDIIMVRTSTGAVEVDLPASGRVQIIDVDGNAVANNITVDPPSGDSIMNGSSDENMLLDLAFFSGAFLRRPSGTNWSVG